MGQITNQWQALTNIQQYQVVSSYLDGISCQLANWPDQGLLSNVLGVVLNNVPSGGLATVVLFGIIYDSNFNWIPNAPVYVGAGGYLTQSIPASSVYQIGKAVGPHSIFVIPSPFLLLNV